MENHGGFPNMFCVGWNQLLAEYYVVLKPDENNQRWAFLIASNAFEHRKTAQCNKAPWQC